jgi:biofilm PGA synthesis N-glycosyltransferase PgaC
METIAFFSALVIVYTYAGYPILLLVWARFAPLSSSGRDDYEPTVSVCLAVHNGSAHIADKIRSLQALDYPRDKIEILIFSDGSTDDTAEQVRRLAAFDSRIVLLSSDARRGKPTALNRLRAAATGEVLLMCDVRQPLAERALRELLRSLSDPSVGCASGSLVLEGNTGAGVYWKYERLIRGSEARIGSMVGVSGSIYAVRRAHMPELPHDLLLDDMFVPLRVLLSEGKRVVLAEAAQAYDRSCDDEREFVRKVRTLAGNYQLFEKMPRLLVPGLNPMWFQMTSHKLLRLVCPWALVALFCSSATLAFAWPPVPPETMFWQTAFISQSCFYGFGALGARAGRVGALARTFIVLNAAAVVGLWRYARGTQAVTW